MNRSLLGDAIAHHLCMAFTSLGLSPPEVDVWAYARATGRERDVELPGS